MDTDLITCLTDKWLLDSDDAAQLKEIVASLPYSERDILKLIAALAILRLS